MADKFRSKLIPGALILSGLEGLVVLANLVLTKSAEGGVLFGLSAARLALAAGTLAITTILFWLGFTWHRNTSITRPIRIKAESQPQNLVFILAWAAVVFLILQSEAYYQIIFRPIKLMLSPELFPQLRPLLLWACLILLQVAIGVTLSEKEQLRKDPAERHIFIVWLLVDLGGLLKGSDRPSLRTFWQRHRASLLIFLGLLVTWAFAALTRIGIKPDDRFWNIAGGPILWHQLILTMLLVLFLLDLKLVGAGAKLLAFSQKPSFPYLLMLFIWLLAVLVWQGTELRHTYFAVNTPPNYETYPFSDAMGFDIGSQYFLMGEGLNNSQLTDRPYLMLYHALLHVIAGQQYNTMAFFQILLLALIPAASFLIGWKLHSKTAGTAIALLIILKEKNAIGAAFQTGLANPKVFTSEMPNALLLVLVALCLLYWFRQQRPLLLVPILAGGLTGLAIGVRGNSLTLLPLLLLLALLVMLIEKQSLKHWLLVSLFFLLGASAILAPYSIETTQKYGAPFWLIKIQRVIDRSEYELTREIGTTNHLNRPAIEPAEDGFAILTLRHFLHNEIATILMLPVNWQAEPLQSAVEHPIWDSKTFWEGSLMPGEKTALGLNLLVLAFGIGYAFKRWHVIGLSPLAIHLTYNVTNAAARTSGGRYLVPTDWVLPLYFILGILAILYALRQWQTEATVSSHTSTDTGNKAWLPVLSLVIFLLIGSSFLLSGQIDQQFDLEGEETRWTYLNAEMDRIKTAGIDPAALQEFIETEGAVFGIGMGLYPRYYQAGERVPGSSYLPDIPDEEAHLYFLLLESRNPRHISIPIPEDQPPARFTNGGYGLVIGCEKDDSTEGKLFIPLGDPESEILTGADLTLSCD